MFTAVEEEILGSFFPLTVINGSTTTVYFMERLQDFVGHRQVDSSLD